MDPILILIFAVIGFCIYKGMNRRISSVEDIVLTRGCPEENLSGIVTSVPDGDGFWFFHTPWFCSTNYSKSDKKLPIRLAGIDAPEMPGNIPGQPCAEEAKRRLTGLIWKKNIDIKIVGIDQYKRALAFAYLPFISYIPGRWFGVNVNFLMVKEGLACVYTGRDAEYNGNKEKLMELEEKAKRRRLGMWMFNNTVTPMQHKRTHRRTLNFGLQFGNNSSCNNVLVHLWDLIFG